MPTAPYDFARTLDYLRTSPAAILERVEGDTYRRAMTIAGQDVLLILRSVGTPKKPRLALDVAGSRVDDHITTATARHIRAIMLLDVDPAPFLATLRGDPVLAKLVRQFAGLRPTAIASPYEALLWAIIGQQINVAFAAKLKRSLVDLCGHSLAIDSTTFGLFPKPATVAALDPAELRARQFSQQKTAYILGVSQAIASGALDLAAVPAMSHDEAIAYLTAHKGIGRWTAEYVLMRGMGAQDSIPAADLGLRAIIGRAYGLGRNATEIEVRAFAEKWAGWRSWAAFYWWYALQMKVAM